MSLTDSEYLRIVDKAVFLFRGNWWLIQSLIATNFDKALTKLQIIHIMRDVLNRLELET